MVPLQVAVIGGDKRQVSLCALLAREGHRVRCFALEKAALPLRAEQAGCLLSCVYGAEWVLLGIPSEKGGTVFAPLSVQTITMEELLGALWPGQVLCGGGFSAQSSLAAVRGGLRVYDLLRRRDYAVGNAALTAEGALSLLVQNSEESLLGSRVLVTGWGRIASLLAPRLRAMGALVTVAARKAGDRAMAAAQGLDACRFDELEPLAGELDFVVNTVPAPVLSDALLTKLRSGTLLLELASSPGFDRDRAQTLGLRPLYAPGLPGQFAPESAAALYWDTVGAILREKEENDGT